VILANMGAAALATYMMFRAAAAEKGGGRKPWLLLAFSGCGFVIVESIRFYFYMVLGYHWPYIWILVVVAYFFVIFGLTAKFAKVVKSPGSLFRSLIVTGVLLVSSALVIYFYNSVFKMHDLPPFAFVIVAVVPLADMAIVLLAVYIATTYAKGVMGRPWVAFAVAAVLSTLGDISYFFAGYTYPRYEHILTDTLYLTTFAGYMAVATGAFYQRLLIAGRPEKPSEPASNRHG